MSEIEDQDNVDRELFKNVEKLRELRIAHRDLDEVIARLPRGYETVLGVWLRGGVDLSVGEWQRLALARTYLRRASVLLLDEPTSAMDPWAEAEWLERLRAVARGRTTIIVTHRLSTAMHADVIHVIHDGRVAESGSHQQLLARGGRYAALWIGRAPVAEVLV